MFFPSAPSPTTGSKKASAAQLPTTPPSRGPPVVHDRVRAGICESQRRRSWRTDDGTHQRSKRDGVSWKTLRGRTWETTSLYISRICLMKPLKGRSRQLTLDWMTMEGYRKLKKEAQQREEWRHQTFEAEDLAYCNTQLDKIWWGTMDKQLHVSIRILNSTWHCPFLSFLDISMYLNIYHANVFGFSINQYKILGVWLGWNTRN